MEDLNMNGRRQELEQALKQAARELLDLTRAESLLLPLDDKLWVAVGPRVAADALPPSDPSSKPRPARQESAAARPHGTGIDVEDEREVKHWMELLDVTREDLVAAIGKVGGGAAAIRAYFAKHHKHW